MAMSTSCAAPPASAHAATRIEPCVDHRCPILIPAYRPGEALVSLVAELRRAYSCLVVIVDDGSGPEFQERFDRLRGICGITILSHAKNLGKGSALKTGIDYIA